KRNPRAVVFPSRPPISAASARRRRFAFQGRASVGSARRRPSPPGDEPGAKKKARRRSEAPYGRFRSDKDYLIFVSLNSTCLRATGSYFVLVIFSVIVRLFFVVT